GGSVAPPSSPPRKSLPPAAIAMVASQLPACASATRPYPPPEASAGPISLADLAITEGMLDEASAGELRTATAKVRAVAHAAGGDAAELRFAYEGPSDEDVPL